MKKLTSVISTIRHGKKNQLGELELIGKIQSAHRAIHIEHLEGDVILFHSGEQRVKNTIRIIGSNIHKKTFDELEVVDEKHDIQDYVVPTLHFLRDKNIKSNYFSKWDSDTNEEKLLNFLNQEKNIDLSVDYNSYEMAQNVARILLTQLQFGLLTSEESKTNFINGSHEPVIMSFLFYVLQDFKPKLSPDQFLSTIGGSVRYSEGFEIYVYQKNNIFEEAILKFRTHEKKISINMLQEFLLQ